MRVRLERCDVEFRRAARCGAARRGAARRGAARRGAALATSTPQAPSVARSYLNSLTANVIFISILVLSMTWNGATFYFEVFAARYQFARE